MVSLHAQLGGAVHVYLMDHRGTGRSTRLDCWAAKPNNGSVWSTEVGASAVGGCARELFSTYGDLSSFSTTSAATDVSHFIGEHTNGKDTIVFGWSYGTALVERLLHLKPAGVTGYVLDGIATSSGAPTDEFPYYSRWDTDFGEVTDRLLALCEQDDDVSSNFKERNLSSTIQHLIKTFAKNPDTACAGILNRMQDTSPNEPPSFVLRRALGTKQKCGSLSRRSYID